MTTYEIQGIREDIEHIRQSDESHHDMLQNEIANLRYRIEALEQTQQFHDALPFRRFKVRWSRDGEIGHCNEGVVYCDGRVHVNYSIENPTMHLSSCGFYESIDAMHKALKETCDGRPAAVAFID